MRTGRLYREAHLLVNDRVGIPPYHNKLFIFLEPSGAVFAPLPTSESAELVSALMYQSCKKINTFDTRFVIFVYSFLSPFFYFYNRTASSYLWLILANHPDTDSLDFDWCFFGYDNWVVGIIGWL